MKPTKLTSSALQSVLCGAIRLYQVALSPILSRGCCRFEPSCSAYMLEAIKTHGILKGCLLGLKRLCCCHPFTNRVGYDPVPSPASSPSSSPCCEPHPKASLSKVFSKDSPQAPKTPQASTKISQGNLER